MSRESRSSKVRARANFLWWLEREHTLADQQLEALRKLLLTEPEEARAAIATERLVEQIERHLESEERQLFPWLVEFLPACVPQVKALEEEHTVLRAMMQDALSATSSGRTAEIERLMVLLDHHAAEEQRLTNAAFKREEDALDW